jgi:CubicO group peptidase (beta-lactamase class C family)
MFRKLILAALVFPLSARRAGIFAPTPTATSTPTPTPTKTPLPTLTPTPTPTPKPDAFDPEGRESQPDYLGNRYTVDSEGKPVYWFDVENERWEKFQPVDDEGEIPNLIYISSRYMAEHDLALFLE